MINTLVKFAWIAHETPHTARLHDSNSSSTTAMRPGVEAAAEMRECERARNRAASYAKLDRSKTPRARARARHTTHDIRYTSTTRIHADTPVNKFQPAFLLREWTTVSHASKCAEGRLEPGSSPRAVRCPHQALPHVCVLSWQLSVCSLARYRAVAHFVNPSSDLERSGHSPTPTPMPAPMSTLMPAPATRLTRLSDLDKSL